MDGISNGSCASVGAAGKSDSEYSLKTSDSTGLTPSTHRASSLDVSAETMVEKDARLRRNTWEQIFALLSPPDLANVRACSKLFYTILDTDTIWERSRLLFYPDFPGPGYDLSEVRLLDLLLGKGCQLCRGPTATVYWPFRVRCCTDCLSSHSRKVRWDW